MCLLDVNFHLFAHAIRHQTRLATLDRRIDPSPLPGGEGAYFVFA
jgi:hypothetical protein